MLSEIRLQQFRSYGDEIIEMRPGVNIIVGPNASGKTNLLEAILVLARGSSYRARDAELIRHGADWARLDGVDEVARTRTVKLRAGPPLIKTYDIDGKPFKRLTLPHTVPVVLFEPNHLLLLHGAPEQRRNYLDDLLEQTVAGYGAYRRNYRRVLGHRNALLKRQRRPTNEELFPWNLRLSELGALLARRRAELADIISTQLPDTYKRISGTTTETSFLYHAQFSLHNYESRMLHKLEESLELDIARGFTAAGPHREDFSVLFDGYPVEDTASRGETRSAILALKIIELEQLAFVRDHAPLLLLDDVFSELDGARRLALTGFLQRYQTFLTTTDADVVLKYFTENAHIIPTSRS